MPRNPAMLAGVLAPLVYLAAVVLGGFLTPGYSHTADAINQLLVPDAPAAAVLEPLFTVYNALLIVFAWRLKPAFSSRGAEISIIAPALIALTGVIGILIRLYPIDPIGALITFGGQMHLWLAGLASLASVFAVLFIAVPLRRNPAWWRFAGYSLISLIVIVFSGAFAVLAARRLSPVMGLWERVTIGALLQWLLVLAVTLLPGERPKRPAG